MTKEKKKKPLLGRFSSIRWAMLVSFSSIMLVALLIFLIIALNYTSNTVLENAIDYSYQLITQVNYDIDSYIDYMENISSMVSESSDVQGYFFGENSSVAESENQRSRIQAQFSTIMEGRKDISNIAITTHNGKSMVNVGNSELNKTVDIENLDWYGAAMNSEDGIALSSSHVQNAIRSSYQWVITLSRALTNKWTGEREGVFFIDLNYEAISTLCNNNKIGKRGYVFIIDSGGNLIYHPKQQLIYGGLLNEYISEIMECETDYLELPDGDDTRLYTKCTSEKTGWTVVGMAYTSELLKNNKQTQLLYIMMAIILIVATVLVSVGIAAAITKPVEQLRDAMERVEHGEFANANVEVMVNNEIGSLTNSFNVMTDQIQKLMEQNIYEQKQKRKSELRALQAQINPHFLYNTLDSIIWMAEGKKNREVVLMTSALARLLRQSISAENELVPLIQEIDYVKNYLAIQKMRYKDKLEYEIEVEPSVKFVQIIKLVLQPLVENAIYHGLKYKERMGHLSIRAYKKETQVCIEIADDGVGMTQEVLDHIFDQHKIDSSRNGVGVYNVQQRLQLYYGEDYGVRFVSSPNEGTTAIVSIPASGGEENEA